MKKIMIFLAFLLISANAFCEDQQTPNPEEDCRQAAAEENIPAAEMDEYIKTCVQELTAES